MFVLNVVDKDKNMLDLLSSRSQVGIDRFTTCFKSEESLLKKLEMDSSLYKIVIENRVSHRNILFTSCKYRNVVYLNDNLNNETDFLSKTVDIDKDLLNDYFNSEIIRFDKDELSDYDNKRLELLKNIISYLDEEKDDSEIFKIRLLKLLKPYFYQNYDYLKSFYMYLVNNGIDFGATYDEDSEKTALKIVEEMKEKIDKAKNPQDNKFLDNLGLKKYKDANSFETEDDEVLSFFNNDYDDEDKERAELDMFMDSKNYTDTRKKKVLEEVLSLR